MGFCEDKKGHVVRKFAWQSWLYQFHEEKKQFLEMGYKQYCNKETCSSKIIAFKFCGNLCKYPLCGYF